MIGTGVLPRLNQGIQQPGTLDTGFMDLAYSHKIANNSDCIYGHIWDGA